MFCLIRFRRGICGSFFLSLLFFRSQVINFLKWKNHYLSENIAIFHSNVDPFTQYLFLNKKRCHLMTFSWRIESERTRGKKNLKFHAIYSSVPAQMYMLCIDITLVTQPMLQRRPNHMELSSMNSYNQILCRFQKSKGKVLPSSLPSTKDFKRRFSVTIFFFCNNYFSSF